MRLKPLLAHLPPGLAFSLRDRIENAALGNHLTEDEVREIIYDIFNRVPSNDSEAELLTEELADSIARLYF